MRFSLLQLLLVFPAFGIAIVLVVVLSTMFGPVGVHYRWCNADNTCRFLEYDVERMAEDADGEIDPETVNLWLAKSLPASHPWAKQLWYEPREQDPWGRPYRCVRRDGKLAIYSLGRDGVSATEGDDPDDLNSWDHRGVSWYRSEVQTADRMQFVFWAALATPLVLAALCRLTPASGGPTSSAPRSNGGAASPATRARSLGC